MLTIRKEQIQAFDDDRRRRFENEMHKHLLQFFPERCRLLGEDQTREWIRHGIAQAARYGIVADRDVCKYIDVMFVYGRDFDRDPRHPWAPIILEPQPTNPSRKADMLLEAAKRHERETSIHG